MSTKPTRQQARQKLISLFHAELDKVLPADENVALRGRIFADFEDQAEGLSRTVATELLQQRAELDVVAWEDNPGLCPHCDSERVYLEKKTIAREFRSPSGTLKIRIQNCRCRACNGSFSPSTPRLAAALRKLADPARAETDLPRSDRAAF